jgi:GWxTD domain-containing protein
MMKKHIPIFAFAIVLAVIYTAAAPNLFAAGKKNPWKEWLDEVDIIITRLERSVANILQTEEERDRFKQMFWKSRDTNPQTPENEYQAEFYQRLYYARNYLKGPKSDRGRIYILLGKPTDKTNFSGDPNLVECELWSYEGNDKPGLLPFMNLLFYKPRDLGDYQLFHPGIHGPRDLLIPPLADRMRNKMQAYKEIKGISAQLASASLSVIPSEGDPRGAMSVSSSNYALNQIYNLPEREAEVGYIKNFTSPTGVVRVTHTTNAIRGFGCIAVLYDKGLPFVHYALMPDVLKLKNLSQNLYEAEINLLISIENTRGGIIYQNHRKIDLKVDTVRKQNIDKRRIVFRDFAPVIEGDYNVIATYINKTTREFFTCEQKITVSPDQKPGGDFLQAAVGFQLKEIDGSGYMPFAAGNFLVLTDPRFTFSQKDALEGILRYDGGDSLPGIFLEKTGDTGYTVPIQALKTTQAGWLKFRQPLNEVKDGRYRLTVKIGEDKKVILAPKLHVLPFYIQVNRPFAMEKPEPASARNNYIFVRAQEYLSAGMVDRAIASFNELPRSLWNAASLPFIGKAYYLKGDYAEVLRLLEKEEVKKEYSTLLMLANSSIELKDYPRALKYLEKIRKYGDTVEINQLLAATYLSMGNREKAVSFYDRARKLKNKDTLENTQNKKKENNHE